MARRHTVVLINGRIVRRQFHRLDEPALSLLHAALARTEQPSSVIAEDRGARKTAPGDVGAGDICREGGGAGGQEAEVLGG